MLYEVITELPGRRNGAMISQEDGEAVAYALFNLQERGRLFVSPGDKVYEGMIVGIHSRSSDLVVNPIKTKNVITSYSIHYTKLYDSRRR